MTKYYLKFDTMKLIVKAPGSSSLEDVLRVICHSAEISCTPFQNSEVTFRPHYILSVLETDIPVKYKFPQMKPQ